MSMRLQLSNTKKPMSSLLQYSNKQISLQYVNSFMIISLTKMSSLKTIKLLINIEFLKNKTKKKI